MGYITNARGHIEVDPPIPWAQVKTSPFRPHDMGGNEILDVALVIEETTSDTDDGQVTIRRATGVAQRWDSEPRKLQHRAPPSAGHRRVPRPRVHRPPRLRRRGDRRHVAARGPRPQGGQGPAADRLARRIRIEAAVSQQERTMRALNILTKWRVHFTGWQLGTRPKGDPEGDAVRDHRECTILLRAEVNALAGLLLAKGVFTEDEWLAGLEHEADHLAEAFAKRWPGVTATEDGLVIDKRALPWMKGWRP